MSKSTAHPGRLAACLLIASLVLGTATHAPPTAAAEAKLRSSREIDLGRVGRVGADERSLLRLEWRSDLSRVDESNVLGDMLQSLARMESTTREIKQLVRAIPDADEYLPSTRAHDNLESIRSNSDFQLKLTIGAAASLLLLVIWLLRRRPRPATPSVAAGPRLREPGTPQPAHALIHEKTAVPPAPTFVPSPPPAARDSDDANAHAADPRQALELAEIMLSMGLANGAAQTLTEHIRGNPKQALYHWLKLLDVYRKSGNKYQFEQSSRELQQHFNIQAENWAQLHPGEVPSLESFPRIADHVEGIWRQPAVAIDYLQHLLADNRGGTRAGFPQPVAEEILLLVAILKDEAAAA